MEVSREEGASKAGYQASSEGKGRDANGAPGTLDAYRPVSIWPRMGRAFPLHWQSARQAVSDFAELSGQPVQIVTGLLGALYIVLIGCGDGGNLDQVA